MGQPLAISSLPPALPAIPAPRGARSLPLAEVARRLDLTERHVARLCAEKWFPNGLATIQAPADGGKPCWHVRDDADPLLCRAVFPEHLKFDQSALTSLQRTALAWRHKIYLAWREEVGAAIQANRNADEATKLFVLRLSTDPALKPPAGVAALTSPATLRRWHADYRRSGLSALVDERWKRRADTSDGLDHPFFAEVLRQYMLLSQPDLSYIHKIVSATAAQRGLPPLSYKKCQRLLSRIPTAAKIKQRKGNKVYVDEAERFAERDYTSLRSNEIWNGDHHRFDVVVSYRGKNVRPWLTAWQDVRSRKIVGYRVFAHDPNTDTILLAFRDGVKGDGVPDEVYEDNGRDYDSKALQGITKRERRHGFADAVRGAEGVFNMLSVKVRHCQPYHGQSKPIERFFGTICREFSKLQPTYTGGTTATKPENLPSKLARGVVPAMKDFAEAFDRWVDYYNNGREHTGNGVDGRTPGAAFTAHLTEKRDAPPEVLDGLTLKPTKPLKIAQNGIRWMGLTYTAPELWARLGTEVRLRIDPEDVRSVRVCDLDGRFICHAEPVRPLAFKASLEDLKALHRGKAKDRKAIEAYRQAGPRAVHDPVDALNRVGSERAAEAARAAEPVQPPTIRLVSGTHADEAAKAHHAAEGRAAMKPAPARVQMDMLMDAMDRAESNVRAPSFAELMEPTMRRLEEERAREEAEADENNTTFANIGRLFARKAE